jgi:hypothetical protein
VRVALPMWTKLAPCAIYLKTVTSK